jgi:hypothetical protein
MEGADSYVVGYFQTTDVESSTALLIYRHMEEWRMKTLLDRGVHHKLPEMKISS